MKNLAILLAALLALALLCACGQMDMPSPAEQTTENITQEYIITPDEEFYPAGYIGYRYPLRPGLASWRDGNIHPPFEPRVFIPEEVIAGMTTGELAQSVVCYPLGSWYVSMMLSSQSEQPAGFVREWFDRRYRDFPALQALAARPDAREELEKCRELYKAFIMKNAFDGHNPELLLQSAQFGGEGIPDYAHKSPYTTGFISAQENHLHRFYLDDAEFAPSESFAYYPAAGDGLRMYFSVEELAVLLEARHSGLAQKLRQAEGVTYIGGAPYLPDDAFPIDDLTVRIGWEYSSHTPVWFSTTQR